MQLIQYVHILFSTLSLIPWYPHPAHHHSIRHLTVEWLYGFRRLQSIIPFVFQCIHSISSYNPLLIQKCLHFLPLSLDYPFHFVFYSLHTVFVLQRYHDLSDCAVFFHVSLPLHIGCSTHVCCCRGLMSGNNCHSSDLSLLTVPGGIFLP